MLTEPSGYTGSVSVLAPWQHLFLRASFVVLDALHGDGSALPPPYVGGPNGVRDRCCRVLCQAGSNINEESYRLVRATVRCVLGTFPCQERLQPPPGQRDQVKHPTGVILFISPRKVGQRRRGLRQTVSARLCGPISLGVWLGRRLLNGDREFPPSRLTRSAPDLQQLMCNLLTYLLRTVQLGYRLTYACDMG